MPHHLPIIWGRSSSPILWGRSSSPILWGKSSSPHPMGQELLPYPMGQEFLPYPMGQEFFPSSYGAGAPPLSYGAGVPPLILWGKSSSPHPMGQELAPPLSYGAGVPLLTLWGRSSSPILWGRSSSAHPMGQEFLPYPMGQEFLFPLLTLRGRSSSPILWGRSSSCHPMGQETFSTPRDQAPPSTGPVTVACLVSGYLPPTVTVTWGGATGGVTTFPLTGDSATGLHRLSSQLLLPHGARDQTYTCTVTHPPTSSTINKKVKGPATPIPPEVQILYTTSCSPKLGEDSVELFCLITGFTPATVEVEWLIDGIPDLLPATQTPPRREEGAATYSTTSRTNVSHAEWSEGKTFTCRVRHPASGTTVQDHARPPSFSNIVLYVLPPNMADLYITRNPKVRCLATNLPSDSGFQLFWIKEKPGVLNPDFLDLQEQFNGTYTATSTLTISTQDWEAGERFTCMVKHDELQLPLNKSISRRSGKVSPPLIFVFPPHAEEMTQAKVTLTCMVYGFQPENIQVQWLKNHENVGEDHYVTTPPLKDGPKESTFFVYSKMTVPKTSWLGGDIYTCMVVHEGLPMRFTQRQMQKGPGN
uniref:Ig-like domain-containing protein n=1 Tax=Aquila chrysaetos chrysaetos TaxID=223781 RepID=A0A663F2A8_AQUCH